MDDQPEEISFEHADVRVFRRHDGVVFELVFPRRVRNGCIASIPLIGLFPAVFGFHWWTDSTFGYINLVFFLLSLSMTLLLTSAALQQIFPRRMIWCDAEQKCRITNIPGIHLTVPGSEVEGIDLLVVHSFAGVHGWMTLAFKNRRRRIRLWRVYGSAWRQASRSAAVDRVLAELRPAAEALGKAIARPVRKFQKAKSSWLSWF